MRASLFWHQLSFAHYALLPASFTFAQIECHFSRSLTLPLYLLSLCALFLVGFDIMLLFKRNKLYIFSTASLSITGRHTRAHRQYSMTIEYWYFLLKVHHIAGSVTNKSINIDLFGRTKYFFVLCNDAIGLVGVVWAMWSASSDERKR